uniref:HECT domain-containing protein n=1 Tax=Biomphalaria glabrata TaxID=6526 RepID=A0A2C9JH74_BIOGL
MSAIFAWGDDNSGALGLCSSDNRTICSPSQIHSLNGKEIQSISSGTGHTLVCLKDGKVLSCGYNDFRQCGRDIQLNKLGEVGEGLQPHHVIQVAAGASHSVVLTQAHEVLTWGKNTEGQLGRGDVEENFTGTPKLIKSLAVHCVVQISCGNDHTMVLTNEGCIATWGSNSFGQLGIGLDQHLYKYRNQPCFIACLKGLPIAQVAAGGNHCLILSKSGAIFGWGRNSFGQLGLNDTIDFHSPNQCRPLRSQRIKYICCGENHTACLTVDGRVFTFGAGTYGQLGHGSCNNEILPRQVIELSGSEVSQIACGRNHTLALNAKSGRLYAFGLGGVGQLGLSTTDNKNTPVFIPCPFVLKNTQHSLMQEKNQGLNLKVKSIYAGGDHSFVITQDQCQPEDYRKEDPARQILTLTPERIKMLRSLQKNDTLSDDINEIIQIFSSASCLNGSFLLDDDKHYNTTSKKHGVDMIAVRKFFQDLSTISNVEIIHKISTAIAQNLCPSLLKSPPDVEALRIYLILPECHLFDQPQLYSSIICPFAKSLLSLSKVVLDKINSWWVLNQPSFFNRLVVSYKNVIKYVFHLPVTVHEFSTDEYMTIQFGLLISLEMLSMLYMINEAHNQIIPYDKFYLPELKNSVDIINDYTTLVQASVFPNLIKQKAFYFCSYPFLFDAEAKSVLLQTDAALQREMARIRTVQNNLMSFFPLQWFNPNLGCLELKVNRNTLVEDTLRELRKTELTELKSPLKIVFEDEEAVDIGGVRKEFFMLFIRKLLDPEYGMFKLHEDSNFQWFDPSSSKDSSMFHMFGIICGLAIYNFIMINLQFPLALFKKLLKRPVTLDDLTELEPVAGRSLQNLLDYDDDDIEEQFLLDFENLCPDGKSRLVNHTNKEEFIDLHVDKLLNKSVEVQFKAFSEGFHSVCGGKVLDLFHPQELQAMVVGNEDYDFTELEKNTEYKLDYHKYHPTIRMFWEVFHSMSMTNKKKFLLFLTGSDRIPVFGMKEVKIIIDPDTRGEQYLPSAHTCFNLLHLPIYKEKSTLQKKLLIAIQQTEGFGMR